MTTIDIRPAADGEYDVVDDLVREAYEHDYGVREHGDDPFRFARARAATTDVWIARDADGAPVGTVTIGRPQVPRLMEDALPDELDFRLLAVSSTARGRGIGEALVRHVIDEARRQGLRKVFLKSAPEMTGAHRLYERLGFDRDPARDGLLRDGEKVLDLFAFVIDVDAVVPQRSAAPAGAAR